MKKKITQKKLTDKLAVNLRTLRDLDLQSAVAGGCSESLPTCDVSTSSIDFIDP